MSDIVTEIRTYLVADASILAAVAQRIYQDQLPQGMETMPAIVLEEISGRDAQQMEGHVVLTWTRVRARCYADTPASAASVRTLVRDRAATARGIITEIFVCGIELDAKSNGIDPPINGSDNWRPYKFQDLMIAHR
jgi:hypothetical protein